MIRRQLGHTINEVLRNNGIYTGKVNVRSRGCSSCGKISITDQYNGVRPDQANTKAIVEQLVPHVKREGREPVPPETITRHVTRAIQICKESERK